ncbi:hypothetical protein DPMN_029272 [Dreissena polymorpha]|uniref:Uncharacterized protein n=1 Tax=Dreissena polymorpha TaxID=45954 RepID=A0A9D4LYR7_DREPO|nr:hypothetical protein DPMN_029272 [Dreissena polymorpha]
MKKLYLNWGAGAPGLVMGPCIYQFKVNRCRNEEVIVKGNFGWAWSVGGGGRPRVGNGAVHNVQYQFEENRCRNEEVIVKGNFGWAWSMWAGAPQVEIDRIVIKDVQYQFEVNRCRNEEVNIVARTDRQTDTQTAEITTISPRFSKSVGIKTKNNI